MRPGLTCLWVIKGRDAIGFDTWMKLDLEYIDNWSLWLDLKIIFLTIPKVVGARGGQLITGSGPFLSSADSMLELIGQMRLGGRHYASVKRGARLFSPPTSVRRKSRPWK